MPPAAPVINTVRLTGEPIRWLATTVPEVIESPDHDGGRCAGVRRHGGNAEDYRCKNSTSGHGVLWVQIVSDKRCHQALCLREKYYKTSSSVEVKRIGA